MEFVPLSTEVLRYLSIHDPPLRRYFQGVFAADQLPMNAQKSRAPQAYIVNTDPISEPGQHWLGVWTRDNVCEVFDSYGLPLHYYNDPTLQEWLRQWKYLVSTDQSLQALDSQTCGHYALAYLKAKARGASLTDFMARWGPDLVSNDVRVANELKGTVQRELSVDGRPYDARQQTNCSRQAFMTCNGLH